MQTPDAVTAKDTRRAIEERLGIEPLDQLLAERAALVEKVASLRARHGPFGTWGDLRKTELATIAMTIRARALRDGLKLTEAGLTDAAHADQMYVEFIIDGTNERAALTIAEDRIQAIEDRIHRDNTLAKFMTSELHLG